MIQKIARIVSLVLLVLAGLFLMALENRAVGWILLLVGVLSLLLAERHFAKHIILIYGSLAILSLVPINTDISLGHMLTMGFALAVAVGMPYVVMRYVYKEDVITYPVSRHTWTKEHIGYLLLTAFLGYLILPFWMQDTGGYLNWYVGLNTWDLSLLFVGTNALGIWDELFFIVTCLAILRRHMPFIWANLIQAALFTSFLYELGFTGWAPLLIYPFALLQGLILRRTENLVYVVAIHLTLDLVLYLALINAHYPDVLNIFITRNL